MADRLHIDTEWLDQCAGELSTIRAALVEASNQLSGVEVDEDSGGLLHFSLNAAFAGQRFSAQTVREAIKALRNAAGVMGSDAESINKAVKNAMHSFEDAQSLVNRYIDGLGSGGNLTVRIVDLKPVFRTENGWNDYIERKAVEFLQKIKQKYEEYRKAQREKARREADNARVFDSDKIQDKKYGGNQGAPVDDKKNYKKFKEIIERNTNRKLSDKELKKYLNRLNNEGCGYVAIINSIFRHYEGRSEEFERRFGFPMYKNGSLNYNEMLVDLYSRTDNKYYDENGNFVTNADEDYNDDDFWERTSKNFFHNYDATTDETGFGTTPHSITERAQEYLEGDATVRVYQRGEITPQNFNEKAKDGDIMILVGKPYTMYDENGNAHTSNGGHWVSITGVENGRYVVSSWGKKYYIDPSDNHGYVWYNQVVFTD